MTIYYLYVKTHRITGLNYLGVTKKDPFKYKGSGNYWKTHIEKYGYSCDTVILQKCYTESALASWGLYYSNLWDIVRSPKWANILPEEGYTRSTRGIAPAYDNNGNYIGCISINDNRWGISIFGVQRRSKKHSEFVSKRNNELIKNGTHNFLKRKDGTSQSSDRVSNGSHNWIKRPDGSSAASDQIATGRHPFVIDVTCPHCGKTGKKAAMDGWHFDFCKQKLGGPTKFRPVQPMITCPHCGKTGNGPRMKSDHFDHCKLNPVAFSLFP